MLEIPARPRFLDIHDHALSAADIALLLSKPSIRGLTFTGCGIGDDAVRALCALPKLERLWLDGSAITDAVLPDIARVPALNWLVLDNTGIGDAGVAALSGHARLHHLSLRGTEVGDACAPHIVSLACLSHLDVTGSAVTRDGVLALAAHPTLTLSSDDTHPAGLDGEFVREQRRLASRTPPGFLPGAGEEAAALAVLHGFWDAISAWETELARDSQPTEPLNDWRQADCAAIFDQFCTPKDRKFGRPNALSFSTPPEYQQHSIIDVEWLSARKVCVYTIHRGHLQRRFVLMKKGSTWLLDHMQNLFDGWTTGYL